MGQILDINQNKPHLTGELICLSCGHRGIHTWPESVWLNELQCPICGKAGYIIGTGQILEANISSEHNKTNPVKQSKPGQILTFPGQNIDIIN